MIFLFYYILNIKKILLNTLISKVCSLKYIKRKEVIFMILEKMYEGIGNTPLVKLNENLYAKVEGKNPSGSIKDRVALEMILQAEKEGLLKEGSTIIEPTSGNTGIGLCAVAVQRGYNAIICMPNNMSKERIKLMEALGATVVLTPKELGMQGSIDMAKDMSLEIKDSFIPSQFDNKANVSAHFKTTGPEIYKDLSDVDVLVCGIGTGGTITGVSKYLKMKKDVYVVGVEPLSSPFLTKHEKGPHKIEGIGAGFMPQILDMDYVDEVITVSDEDAITYGKEIMKKYGIFAGISSGAAYKAALDVQKRMENKKIVVIFPDGCEKYMSTKLFED